MKYCFRLCAEELDQSELHWHSRYKPFGYTGDFLIIDWIHTRRIASEGRGRLWDEFLQRLPIAVATRNRKAFFGDVFVRLCHEAGRGISVLDLASGPCRDLTEAVSRAGAAATGSRFHCVDIDERAISYARALLPETAGQVTWEWEVANVFEIEPERSYDLVWAAGLFDYLDERYATALLRRMWDWAKPGGTIVVGNAHARNPSRNYMEWCTEWFLIHRTEDDLRALCARAGIPPRAVSFAYEPLGIWMFCVIRRLA
jgi:extracellular factor (EF) 3-hydroxypalmitic acid methyl ester biosynthesis protein